MEFSLKQVAGGAVCESAVCGGAALAARRWRRATTTDAAAPALSQAAGLPREHGQITREVLSLWVVLCGEGALTAVVHWRAVWRQLHVLRETNIGQKHVMWDTSMWPQGEMVDGVGRRRG